MLTRLRVQGFKNLSDVDVRFGPFTCVAGPNGAGKSNLFDAIHFLHLLTEHQLPEAAQAVRQTTGRTAEPSGLFTRFGKFRAPEIRITADLIVDRDVHDDFGVAATAATSALRYQLALTLDESQGVHRLKLLEESLSPIRIQTARRELGFPASTEFLDSCITGRRPAPFISTKTDERGEAVITVHQEGHGSRKLPAENTSRTVIGGMATSEFPTVLAVHREMQSWRTLLLEPTAMRAPSSYSDEPRIDEHGANLPATIRRLTNVEERTGQVAAELANRLSGLLGDVQELRIREDEGTESWSVEVRGRDGVFHPARNLSDGTLRFLVLATLGVDPEVRGMVCLEEPENGIHPDRIGAMLELLRQTAVDSQEPVAQDNPLRQVVVNTHSPAVIANIDPNDLVYMQEERVGRDGSSGQVAVVSAPESSWRVQSDGATRRLAPGTMKSFFGGNGETNCAQLYFDWMNKSAPLEEPAHLR